MVGKDGRQKTRRRMVLGGLLATAVAVLVAVLPAVVQAADMTTVHVKDGNGVVSGSKVTVADAQNGRPVASGVSDAEGTFAFPANPNRQYMVTAHTSTGYVGLVLVGGGSEATLNAGMHASNLPFTTITGTSVTVTLTDAHAAALADSHVSVVTWGTFEPVARGVTDSDGQFSFRVPSDLTGTDFLAVVWSDDGHPQALYVVVGSGGVPSPDGLEWPAF